MKWAIAVAGLILFSAASAAAQKLDVKIIDRQDKEDSYDYAAVYNNVAVGKSFTVRGRPSRYNFPMADSQLSTAEANLQNTWLVQSGIGGAAARLWWIVFKLTSRATMQS